MKKVSLVRVTSDDGYEAYYMNGDLIHKGHSINVAPVFESLLGKELAMFRSLVADEGWLELDGDFPQQLSQVKLASP